MGGLIQEIPEGERPRERLRDRGGGALRDAELVAILLRVGVKGASAVEVGEQLLQRFGGLDGLARASVADLTGVTGVGEAKAVQLKAAVEIGVRLARRRAAAVKLDDASRIAGLVGPELRLLQQESARVVLLNAKLHLIGVEEVSQGLLDQALVHAREVFSPAIARRAYAVVLSHNHPGGTPEPSQGDVSATQLAIRALSKVGVLVLDHAIIADGRALSMRAAGLIDESVFSGQSPGDKLLGNWLL